ncbi:putative nucleotide-diphospho-sugar transferase [Psychroserpens jangbogonensis]|uniref:putative nucleotide-diphospho-sugar transferase n=1 Tax=Psychroserpens jangbogonensis TaxID=1484460 RepID=UPI00053D0D9A|nr:putative nucleotide-diphospho-sugar transferase [Psychroserpens jangbogonensis]
MSTCIISGRFPATEFKANINHKIYADTYGYSYIHCNWPTTLNNNYLNKIAYILHHIDDYDYIVWIDDDAFFFDFEKDIMEYAPKNDSFISLCKSPSFKELKTHFSSGQFIVKCNELSKRFFQDVLKIELNFVKEWWPDKLGFFTNGDQDIMVYLLLENTSYKGKLDLYDYNCFNSRWENLSEIDVHKPFILHFTGRGQVKRNNYIETQLKFNLHASLVSNSTLEKYGINTLERYNCNKHQVKNKSFTFRVKSILKRWLQG